MQRKEGTPTICKSRWHIFGNLQGEVQTILVDSAVQTDIRVQEDEKVEEASVQAEVEAAVEAFKLADHQASYDSDDSAFESEDEY